MSVNAQTKLHDNHQYHLPVWKGQKIHGKSIRVFDEQVLNDTIMLSRYLVNLKACGAHIVFVIKPELLNLFRNWPLVDELVTRNKTIRPMSSCHYGIQLADLAERFQTRPDTIPVNIPYLFADPAKTAYWSEKISGPDLKIGLVGSLDLFGSLCHIDGLQWYNLQNAWPPSDDHELNYIPANHNIAHELKDFSDTAAAISNLDLVISTDSPIAHLAAAMGKPVWVTLPFISGQHSFPEKDNTPLYPSVTLYRQPSFGDWESHIVEISNELKKLRSIKCHSHQDDAANRCYDAALSYQREGAVDKAEAGYQKLLSLVPDHYPALTALGLLYLNSQRYDAAVHVLCKAFALKPVDHLSLNNLGFAFQRLGQTEAAMSLYAGAIVCKPDFITAYQNLGNVFLDLNNTDAVIHWYLKALEITPDNADAQLEMGKLYLNKLDTSNARKHFENVVALEPRNVSARISLATTALIQGDYPVGWDQYRWRFKDHSIAGATYPAKFNIPQWQGEQFKNKRLIIHCEQGLGDTIQFSRFIPLVKALGGEIVFQVQEALLPLFQHYPGIDVLQPLPSEQPEMPDADLYCPLMDLPHWLGISTSDVVTKSPYIFADAEKVVQWHNRIDPDYFSVGIVWEGNLDNANGRNRACPLSHLLELEQIAGIRFYVLQKQVSKGDSKLLKSHPDVTFLGADFANTAAAIACLDLVISVDTAVAHLAGAMGKPVWLMLPYVPDWRWMLHRTDSPWYPTMRLFRQPFEDKWAPVVQSIKRDIEAHLNERGIEMLKAAESYVAEKRWQKASHIYSQLTTLIPYEPDVHHLHGLVLKEQREYPAALQNIDRAISIQPNKATYLLSRGDLLETLGDLDTAKKTYQEVLILDPSNHHAMINLGNIYYQLDQPDQALEYYQSALAFDPENTCAMNNIGKITFDLGNVELALEWYHKAISLQPGYAEARFNRAVGLLTLGDYSKGWKEYEWRFKRKGAHKVYPHSIHSQRWDGSSFVGQHLLVHCEQGMGDIIQFCRYLPKVKALGGQLTVEVHAPLAPLLRQMPEVDHIIVFNHLQPPSGRYDLYIPMLSLPLLFETTQAEIPDRIPYIQPSPTAISQWQTEAHSGDELCIGVVWSGSDTDPRRTCPLPLVKELMTVPGINFYSLQIDSAKSDIETLQHTSNMVHWGDRLNDFDDTAAAIHHLDLIISVDTATAHLAGAMGKPVWVLLPYTADWRWLKECENSPWYPTARLFRQPKSGDWQSVISQVKSQLLERSQIQSHKQTNHQQQVQELFDRATSHHRNHELDQAICCYKKALSFSPELEEAHRNLGLAYYQKGELSEAAKSYRKSIRLQPDSVDILLSLGALYTQMGRHSEAEALYGDALILDTENESVLYNLGNLYLETGKLESAAEQYRMVINRNPEHTKALCNLGRTKHRQGDIENALSLYERALEIDPSHPIAHVNLAVVLLLQGKWHEGWDEYEWRLKGKNMQRVYPHNLKGKRWAGESFAGKTLLIHGEQGFGDAIQFVRFLPMVKALGGRVVLETHASLIKLFSSLGSVDRFIELSAQQPPQVQYDLFFPLCSLARHFNVSPDNVPSATHYLHAEDQKVTNWRSRLPYRGLNVGITWAGSGTYPERSCTLEDLSPLAQLQGVNLIGLQKGPAAAQINDDTTNSGFAITNWGDNFKDFSDTAAAISNMDLIISIDTAVAHLAGALGKPVWLLLPKVADWRWMLHRTDTPWYPTMRLFRQSQHADWKEVVQNIIREIQSMKEQQE